MQLKRMDGSVIGDGENIRAICEANSANLEYADLTRADLTGANLTGANLEYAKLTRADLTGANLTGANLTGADLTRANLEYAKLTRADLTCARLPHFQIVPEVGQFSAFKHVNNGAYPYVIELLIPSDAQRTSSLIGRKCRASHATVVNVFDREHNTVRVTELTSPIKNGPQCITYRPGETVYADKYDPDIRVECAGGIHFYMTFAEAAVGA